MNVEAHKWWLKRELASWLLAVILFSVSAAVLFRTGAPVRWASVALVFLVLARKDWELTPAAVLLFWLFQGIEWLPDLIYRVPTAPFLVPFLICVAICLPFRPLRTEFKWLRKGQTDQVTWLLVALTSLLSALALVLWALWTDYLGIASTMLRPFREVPLWFMIFFGIPGFALLNAFAEEVVYRGVLQSTLEKRFPGRTALVLSAQASAFAAAHYVGGFPNGKIGLLMTFIYALMLGFLKLRTGGMLAPYVAHVAADYVIGLTLLLLAA